MVLCFSQFSLCTAIEWTVRFLKLEFLHMNITKSEKGKGVDKRMIVKEGHGK